MKAYYQQQSILLISFTVPIKAKTPYKRKISRLYPPIITSEVEVIILKILRGRRVQQPQYFNI